MDQLALSSAPAPPSGPLRLLDLPPELRLKIYRYIFSSSIVYVKRATFPLQERSSEDEKPPPIRLAGPLDKTELHLTRVNQQIRRETEPLWHSQVTYSFPTPIEFADVLSQWPASKISTIRHAEITNLSVGIPTAGCSWLTSTRTYPENWSPTYRRRASSLVFATLLAMFSGLNLDTITLREPAPGSWREPDADAYYYRGSRILGNLIILRHTRGWRNCRVISSRAFYDASEIAIAEWNCEKSLVREEFLPRMNDVEGKIEMLRSAVRFPDCPLPGRDWWFTYTQLKGPQNEWEERDVKTRFVATLVRKEGREAVQDGLQIQKAAEGEIFLTPELWLRLRIEGHVVADLGYKYTFDCLGNWDHFPWTAVYCWGSE